MYCTWFYADYWWEEAVTHKAVLFHEVWCRRAAFFLWFASFRGCSPASHWCAPSHRAAAFPAQLCGALLSELWKASRAAARFIQCDRFCESRKFAGPFDNLIVRGFTTRVSSSASIGTDDRFRRMTFPSVELPIFNGELYFALVIHVRYTLWGVICTCLHFLPPISLQLWLDVMLPTHYQQKGLCCISWHEMNAALSILAFWFSSFL